MDDFGTGYSSLSYLKKLPLDRLKIDRAFVVDIDDEDSKALTLSIIALAKAMRFDVIAEGVENSKQENFLIENGCKHAQGFFYHKPLTIVEIESLICPTHE